MLITELTPHGDALGELFDGPLRCSGWLGITAT
jgi:hypothetical protein